MFADNMAKWFAIVLMAPFWWGMALLLLALLGDLVPRWRRLVSHLFDGLQHLPELSPDRAKEPPHRLAA